jgi:hypothetical protein
MKLLLATGHNLRIAAADYALAPVHFGRKSKKVKH